VLQGQSNSNHRFPTTSLTPQQQYREKEACFDCHPASYCSIMASREPSQAEPGTELSPGISPGARQPENDQVNELEKVAEMTNDSSHAQPSPPPGQPPYSAFSRRMRTYLTYLLGVVMILSTLTATIYFPLIPLLSVQFGVSIQAINLTVTVYAVFQALTPAIFASLTDAFGRRPVLIGLISIYACASLGLALNRGNYVALVFLRALQSIGGSSTPTLGYGVVADMATLSERGGMLGPMLSTCNAISAIGPVIGGAVALGTSGVAWVFWGLFMTSMVLLLLVGFSMPETGRGIVGNGSLHAVGVWRTWWDLLRSKGAVQKALPTEEKGDVTNNDSDYAVEGQRIGLLGARPAWKPQNFLDSLRMFLHPDAALVLLMVASSYCVYYTYQVAIPVIFDQVYGYNELEIGLTFLPGLAGMTIGGVVAGKLQDRNFAKTAREQNMEGDLEHIGNGQSGDAKEFPVEAARYRNCIPLIVLMTALVVGYGWAVVYRMHPAVLLIFQFLAVALSTMLSHTASTLLVDIFPNKSSTAYAAGQMARAGLSAVSAAIVQPLVDAVGRGWYFTIFALVIGSSCLCSVLASRMKGVQWRHARQEARRG